MAEPHLALNALEPAAAALALRRACGAERWVSRMLEQRPFESAEHLYRSADEEWRACVRQDILEAFAHHPRIGEDMDALRQRFQNTAALSSREQAGIAEASDETLRALRDANAAYFARFGFIFIICATGRSADEMLSALQHRLGNDPDTELRIAAAEHAKITRLRLAGLGS
jgi:2-oxo-4-hydroxy-4-carboxy-5-ureidoimidazoline decarboxylase